MNFFAGGYNRAAPVPGRHRRKRYDDHRRDDDTLRRAARGAGACPRFRAHAAVFYKGYLRVYTFHFYMRYLRGHDRGHSRGGGAHRKAERFPYECVELSRQDPPRNGHLLYPALFCGADRAHSHRQVSGRDLFVGQRSDAHDKQGTRHAADGRGGAASDAARVRDIQDF